MREDNKLEQAIQSAESKLRAIDSERSGLVQYIKGLKDARTLIAAGSKKSHTEREESQAVITDHKREGTRFEKIRELLTSHPAGLSPLDIANKLHDVPSGIRTALFHANKKGKLINKGGIYTLPKTGEVVRIAS